jgi:hypothetical protein
MTDLDLLDVQVLFQKNPETVDHIERRPGEGFVDEQNFALFKVKLHQAMLNS